MEDEGTRAARVEDVHAMAMAMPHVTVVYGTGDNPVYQVGGKSFIFFRNPRPDAVDPETGERYQDVIVFWVASEVDKQALVQDQASPFFTTAHFDGHPSVLVAGRPYRRAHSGGAGRTGPGRVAVTGVGAPSSGLAQRSSTGVITAS